MINFPKKQIGNTFITFEDNFLRPQAEKLAKHLHLEEVFSAKQMQSTPHSPDDFYLSVTKNRLELRIGDDRLGPLFVDFESCALQFRIKQVGRKKEAIARAAGLKKNKNPIIYDLTAGLGRDAFILASLGCHIHLFERNKIVAALLADGLARARKSEPYGPTSLMTLHQGDALEEMKLVAENIQPEVIYLDPMFPHRRKSALVKKEMRIIRELVGDDQDAKTLFIEARKFASDRVVCKRPKEAATLSSSLPNMSIKSKKYRFDVYFLSKC